MPLPQTCIAPDAPWTTFINARSRALSAYGLFQDSRRHHGLDTVNSLDDYHARTRSAAQQERVSAAFVRLSLALDKVTVPIQVRPPLPLDEPHRRLKLIIDAPPQYWSETPYEAVGSAASHMALVGVLDECELRLRRIVGTDTSHEKSPRQDGELEEEDDDSLEGLTAWLVRPLPLSSTLAPLPRADSPFLCLSQNTQASLVEVRHPSFPVRALPRALPDCRTDPLQVQPPSSPHALDRLVATHPTSRPVS